MDSSARHGRKAAATLRIGRQRQLGSLKAYTATKPPHQLRKWFDCVVSALAASAASLFSVLLSTHTTQNHMQHKLVNTTPGFVCTYIQHKVSFIHTPGCLASTPENTATTRQHNIKVAVSTLYQQPTQPRPHTNQTHLTQSNT